MARINTNVASLIARTDLNRAQGSLNQSMQRLSSGLRINRGADDPAGLIASEALRSEMAGIRQAIDNSQRAANVIATGEGALSEVASLLVNIKQLTVQAANTGGVSPDEIRANQLQVDSAVESITRIANVTNFAGLKLLNGSLDYNLSGVRNSAIDIVHVQNAQLGNSPNIPVSVSVLTSARPAQLQWRQSALTTNVTIEVQGSRGVETISFRASTPTGVILSAINQVKQATGVSAILRNGNANSGIVFYSTGWGSRSMVSVSALPNSPANSFTTVDPTDTPTQLAYGRDVTASINGGYIVGDGLNLSLNSNYLSMDLTLDPTLGAKSTAFTITGGGAVFQLGPHVNINEQRSFGIQSITASNLGNSATGFLSQIVTGGAYTLGTNRAASAAEIVDAAITQVASLRGRLGAFEKNTLDTNMRSLDVSLENVTASESNIRDADFAAETAAMTRGQILTSAATSVLAIANQTPQSVLQLLK